MLKISNKLADKLVGTAESIDPALAHADMGLDMIQRLALENGFSIEQIVTYLIDQGLPRVAVALSTYQDRLTRLENVYAPLHPE